MIRAAIIAADLPGIVDFEDLTTEPRQNTSAARIPSVKWTGRENLISMTVSGGREKAAPIRTPDMLMFLITPSYHSLSPWMRYFVTVLIS